MPSKRYNAEEIIHKLREADVLLDQEFRAGSRRRALKTVVDSFFFEIDRH